ncbi:MAG: dTMP kinase [Candidatus Eisenbacteria sp.]|nr:dTMP kinase [Candidatus Eisenbacteria bacterium]
MQLSKGLLIAIEGIDGTGKSTQARRLVAALVKRGYSVALSCEPTGGPHGRRILEASKSERSLSPREEVDLFIADRKAHIQELIKPALKEKEIVVLDRYYFSSVAYQGVLEGMTPDGVREANEAFAPEPDLWLIMDTDPATGLGRVNRRGQGTTGFEREEYLEKVAAVFRSLTGPRIRHVDASASVDDVAGQIEAAVLDLCEKHGEA